MFTDSEVLPNRRRVRNAYDSRIENQSREVIAHGALTNSKRPESFVRGVYPTHVSRSYGCKVMDTMGNEYIDFTCSLGTNLLGYGHEKIKATVEAALQKGISFPLSTPSEITLGKEIQEIFPFVERMRFLKSGSEGCSAAIKIARAFTGRPGIVSEGYHGWHDEFISLTSPAKGVCPELHWISHWKEYEFLPSQIAAFIIEPVITDWSETRRLQLVELREFCTLHGILLIFDETITALRVPKLSIASFWDIRPDLIIFGKALAAGLPLSCIGGKKEIMESDYFVSSTFAGEILSLEAAHAVLSLLKSPRYSVDYLWAQGAHFIEKFNQIGSIQIEGYPTRGVFTCTDSLKKDLFFQECCLAGILLGSSFFFCFPHVEIVEEVLSSFRDIQSKIQRGEVLLKGERSLSPFSQKVRQA